MNYYYLTIVCLNFFFIIYFRKLSSLLEILDKPNEAHKIHKSKIPAIGGILMFINILFLVFVEQVIKYLKIDFHICWI